MNAGDRASTHRIPPALRPAIFLDRDDTLIANREVTAALPHPGDLYDPALVRLLPGVADGLRTLRAAGFLLICITNQGAIARGHARWDQVIATNRRVRELITAESGRDLDALYFCPYHPKGAIAPWKTEHPWRKPQPGMVLQAAHDFAIDLARSWMVGDAERDIESALAAGIPLAHTIIVGDARAARVGNRTHDFASAASTVIRLAAR
jgi:D-glycero-D-manno-heptose 1,7-bisphosphate phosphatase